MIDLILILYLFNLTFFFLQAFNQSVSKPAYIEASNDTKIKKKLCYEELQPITNHEEKDRLTYITILKIYCIAGHNIYI